MIVTKKPKKEENPDWEARDESSDNETTSSMTSTSGTSEEGGILLNPIYFWHPDTFICK